MLARARSVAVPGVNATVARIDAEGIIGLKAQAMANAPARRRQDEADIIALLRAHVGTLDLELVRSYFRAFDMTGDLQDCVLGWTAANHAGESNDIPGKVFAGLQQGAEQAIRAVAADDLRVVCHDTADRL